MAGEVLVDALPYIDSGYDEAGVKQSVCLFKYINNNFNFFKSFNKLLKYLKKRQLA